jgi:hypothetical protein
MQSSYTRQELQQISEERLAAIVKEKVTTLVYEMKHSVLNVARGLGHYSTTQTVFRPRSKPDEEILATAIEQLRGIFPGVTIEQIDTAGGPAIHFDWSAI